MAVPSARPSNRQINFQMTTNLDWNNGSAFTTEEATLILSALQAGQIDRIDAQAKDGTSVTLQVKINGTPVVWAGSVNTYTATTTVGGLAALNTNTFVAEDKITVNATTATTTTHVAIQITLTLRDV